MDETLLGVVDADTLPEALAAQVVVAAVAGIAAGRKATHLDGVKRTLGAENDYSWISA